ncbi:MULTISPECIES: hypothetical protein [unclassified Marinobacter]|jgi:protein tyrosine phosphatase (PTP) superfamily phosphohydrolase (DUF442 family)|uniref:hypothetical protein n=1 Tax=unclassified Marinobacter TaxID=83889 RepID=UPI000C988DB0|nr:MULTISPECIES: hypothetical protein [unclassified Marinobacter]MAK47790.1 hypothetical protein [Marinobacter sp.]|tara:strand:+ start:1459 stop:1911 length:453 start_codon:yes stop_codon:yes gene_type:complete
MADVVDNKEGLFRAVRNRPGQDYKEQPDGTLKVASSAFNDSSLQPSVNREILRPAPIETKFSEDDGVVRLIAEDIRAIDTISMDADGNEIYVIDVIHRPISDTEEQPGNDAHAQVEHTPGTMTKNKFRKLKEALAFLANQKDWVIKPGNR